MYEMIAQFKKDIIQAIHQYEQKFTDEHPMSQARSVDIIDCYGLLQQPYKHVDEYSEALLVRLSHIKTGWWIFKTGNSRLRDEVTEVIQHYKQPLVRLLLTKIQDVESQNAEFETRRQRGVQPASLLQTLLQEKEKQVRFLQQEVARLQKSLLKTTNEIELLERENKTLRETALQNEESKVTITKSFNA